MRNLATLALSTTLIAASGCSNPQDAASESPAVPAYTAAQARAESADAEYFFADQGNKDAQVPQTGPMVMNGIPINIWGNYTIQHVLFPREKWTFYVVVIPKNVRQGTLIKLAKTFYSKYPNTRVRFFNDTKYLQQYVDRDKHFNDSTGRATEVDFPNDEWVQNHLLGNINNRSTTHSRHWMLESRYGDNLALLP